MRPARLWPVAGLMALVFTSLSFFETKNGAGFAVPPGWPKPVFDFKKKPVTREKFLLGSRLFYDPMASKDSTVSCASCHLSFTAFTHADHRVSHGIYGRQGFRNSSALINLAWSRSFMWDGSVGDLAQQALRPIESPTEMGSSMETVVERLNGSKAYRGYFFEAFGDSLASPGRVLDALAAFTVMLVSSNSKYDSVVRKDAGVFFTKNEANGYRLFQKNCASCHAEPLFTNGKFENNGLAVDTFYNDLGRMKVTGKVRDRLKFKVPTLRNVEFSGPYFHDGRVNKLGEAIDHYTDGIAESPTLAKGLRRKITLDKREKKDLVAFLKTLTDKAFLYNVAFRFDHPSKFQDR